MRFRLRIEGRVGGGESVTFEELPPCACGGRGFLSEKSRVRGSFSFRSPRPGRETGRVHFLDMSMAEAAACLPSFCRREPDKVYVEPCLCFPTATVRDGREPVDEWDIIRQRANRVPDLYRLVSWMNADPIRRWLCHGDVSALLELARMEAMK